MQNHKMVLFLKEWGIIITTIAATIGLALGGLNFWYIVKSVPINEHFGKIDQSMAQIKKDHEDLKGVLPNLATKKDLETQREWISDYFSLQRNFSPIK